MRPWLLILIVLLVGVSFAFCARADGMPDAPTWEENFAYERVSMLDELDQRIDTKIIELRAVYKKVPPEVFELRWMQIHRLRARRDCIAAAPDRRTLARCAP